MDLLPEAERPEMMTPAKQAIAEGRELGREEGIRQTQLDNARKMKVKGLSVSDIAEITGLTPAEIGEL